MSDYIIGCFAVAFRFCCSPGPLQFLLGIIGWLRDGENEPGLQDQTSANRRDQPRIVFSFDDGKMDRILLYFPRRFATAYAVSE